MSRRASNAPIHLAESRIVTATIFSDSAHVTRRVELTLASGTGRVAFGGLPPGLDPGAIRVKTSRGLVRAIEPELVPRPSDGTSDTALLRGARDAIESKLFRLSGELEALRQEIALLDQLAPSAVELPHGPTSLAPLRPDVFLAGLEVVSKRRAETAALIRTKEHEAGHLQRDLGELDKRIALVGRTAGAEEQTSVLVVTLDVPEDGPVALELTYDAAWATWRPYYHVRSNGKDDTVECVRFADLWQETGEDWEDVKLRLSSAEPELGLVVPAVLPWTLGLAKSYEDKIADLYRERRVAKPKPLPDAMVSLPGAPPPAVPMAARQAPAAAPMAQPMAPPMAKSRGGFFGGLGGGGAPSRARADDLEEAEITGDVLIAAPEQAKDAMDAYAEQFQAEGVFAEITASGAMAMRSSSSTLDGMIAETLGALEGGAPLPPPPPAFGGPPKHRGPAPDHPDRSRLEGSRLPKDSSGGLDFELEVGGRATCRSGKERQRLGFGSVVYPAKIEYLLRPAVKDHAFGRVTVVNSEPVPLLAGPAAIFVGDAFFGETAIATTPPGGKLVLDLGAETAIKSARRTKTTVRTEGILTKEDVHVVEVTIEIESFLGRTAEVEVKDQVPLSRDPKIKVRLLRTSPKDAELDELTGVLTFEVRVPSGTKTELSIVYEIEAPKDYQFRQILAG